jgi:phosphatidylinositol alpha-1,6-mannosyltransferase
MAKILIVTNDFPPRAGGIQSFVHALALRLPPGQVVVYAPAWAGTAEFDQRQPFPVLRHPTSLMLPVPSVRRARPGPDRARLRHGAVRRGRAAGTAGSRARSAGAADRGLTHGHEWLGGAAGRPQPAAPDR